MYLITDNYGTRKVAWRFCDAMEWLRYCSPVAEIRNRITGRVMARREVL